MNGGWTLLQAARLARRELRGGLKGFRVFLACLMLGVAAIAGVGSLSASLTGGLARDAKLILGADIDIRLVHRPAEKAERDWLRARGQVSELSEMRAMARTTDGAKRALVELKGVDGAYPLYGQMKVAPDMPLAAAFAGRGGRPGAVADANLLDRLGLKVGDLLQVGDTTFVVQATVVQEPDRAVSAFNFGPRLMVARAAVEGTGLVQPGSQIRYDYRVRLPAGADSDAAARAFVRDIERAFPDAGWRVRLIDQAAPGLERFVGRLAQFLTLVGLTALLVGGVGVANAVASYIEGKTTTIATLRCLGAPGGLVVATYLLQIMALAVVGIAAGLALGALLPALVSLAAGAILPVKAEIALYPAPLGLAALFGLLAALVFSLWPLSRVLDVRAAALFRSTVAPTTGRPRLAFLAAILALALLLAGLAVESQADRPLALWFVLGSIGAMMIFGGAGVLTRKLAAAAPRPRRPGLRLALANLHRPGAPTGSIVLSLGIGLTVLVAVALIEGNLQRQVRDRLPDLAPTFYFIDIQSDRAADFDRLVKAHAGVDEVKRVPMIRGRISRISGKPIEEVEIAQEARWAVTGDRGLTYATTPPEGARLVAGRWWPADYQGPPLISVSADIARGFGVDVGDTITLNVLGRDIEARIASLREIDWGTLAMNFAFVFAPGTLEAAPHTHLASVRVTPAEADRLERAVTDAFPNVSAIRVKDALDAANRMLDAIGVAVRLTGSVTLLAGTLVLIGAFAAGQHRRIVDAVVLKVLGATRRDVVGAFALEYGLLGLATSVVAAIVGTIAAAVILIRFMRSDFVFLPETVILTALAAALLTIALGLAGTWRALGQKAAPILRNE